MTVAVELSLLPLAALLARTWSPEPLPAVEWTPRGLALGALSALPPVALLQLARRRPISDLRALRTIRTKLRELVGSPLAALRWWHMVMISAAAGLGEEMFFRGALQPRLGLLLTSGLFGLLHPLTPAYIALAGVMSGYLGWLYLRSGDILVPILAHAIYDAFALWILRGEMRAPDEEGGAL